MRLKKVKGAIESITDSEYYVDCPKSYKGMWNEVFKNENPIHVEIGMGKGKFIIEMAKRHPSINFIGIEMYDSVLVKATQALKNEEKINNLKLLLVNANSIEEIFDHEVKQIYLNFSNPWPKARHEKRRLTSCPFLERYDIIMQEPKRLTMKTDNIDLFNYSITSLKNYGYNLTEITYDLESLHDEDNVLTEYERKFMEQGIKINRLKAIK